MAADPYTVVEDAIRERWGEFDPEGAISATAIRALLDAGYQITHDHDCTRQAIDDGVLEQVGYGGCTGHSVCHDDEHEWFIRYQPDGLLEGHPIWPVYRVVTDNQEGES